MLNRLFFSYIIYPFIERYQGRKIREKVKIIKEDASLPFSIRIQLRKKDLIKILNLAKSNVPYYRELFKKINFNPQKLEKDLRYFNDVPFLTKELIREKGDQLINSSFSKEKLHIRKTGASTGPSAFIFYSQEALDWTAASNLFVLEWTGKKRFYKEIHLSSRFPEIFPIKDRIKEKIKCLAMNRVNVTTDSFQPKNFESIIRKIKKIRPFLIQGHPSTLYALALYCRKHELDSKGIFKIFESTGEVLDEKKREIIKNTFGCQIFNRYGSAEFGVIAHEYIPDSNELKVLDFMVWPEVCLVPNEGNEIVLTSLRNNSMPLIRYRTGDLGDLIIKDDGYYLKNILGRIHDLIMIGDQCFPSHYIQDLLDRIGGIDEFQIETKKNHPTILRIVASSPSIMDEIRNKLNNWFKEGLTIEFTDFEGLKRVGWRSKFKYLVESGEVLRGEK